MVMTNPVILIAELFILSRISGILVRTLANIIGVRFMVVLLFPGTIIHELSHLFTAEILGVRTGKLSLVPEGLEGPDGQEIQAGSVAIAKTDPIRRTVIGLAPVFVGLAVLAGLSYFLSSSPYSHTTITTILLYYLLFTVSNTMFSSREDMKGVIPVFITLSLFTTAAYVAGVRFTLTGKALELAQQVISSLSQSLLLVLAVNILLLLILKVLLVLTKR